MKEDPAVRKERQLIEEWQFCEVLRRAGNTVDAEIEVANDKHPAYPFRVDYVLNDEIAVELQGIGFGHHAFSALMRTYRKHNAIAARGWLLVQVTREMVANGDALEALSRCGVKVEAK